MLHVSPELSRRKIKGKVPADIIAPQLIVPAKQTGKNQNWIIYFIFSYLEASSQREQTLPTSSTWCNMWFTEFPPICSFKFIYWNYLGQHAQQAQDIGNTQNTLQFTRAMKGKTKYWHILYFFSSIFFSLATLGVFKPLDLMTWLDDLTEILAWLDLIVI